MDIIAAILELAGTWLVGNRKRICFIIFILCGLCWIYVAIDRHVYGLLLISIPNIVINIRNFIKWSNIKIGL